MFNEGKTSHNTWCNKSKNAPNDINRTYTYVITNLIIGIDELYENKTRNWLRLKPW